MSKFGMTSHLRIGEINYTGKELAELSKIRTGTIHSEKLQLHIYFMFCEIIR